MLFPHRFDDYQHSLSRRDFLYSAVLTAGVVGVGNVLADAVPAVQDHWVLLADTHFPGDRSLRRHETNAVENFTKIRERILALTERPAGVIIAGDSVDINGLPEDYATLRAECQPLRDAGIAVHIALGNHDHRNNFMAACDWFVPPEENQTLRCREIWKDAPAAERRCVQVIETPRANWFLLDSLDKTNVTPGVFGALQLAWLDAELAARRDRPAILIGHHNPEVIPRTGLEDAAAFFALIDTHPHAKGYFFGHTHAWAALRWSRFHLVNLPATAWAFNPHYFPGWVDARLHDTGCTLTLNCVDETHPQHASVYNLRWH